MRSGYRHEEERHKRRVLLASGAGLMSDELHDFPGAEYKPILVGLHPSFS
jgi:hypothetical protein